MEERMVWFLTRLASVDRFTILCEVVVSKAVHAHAMCLQSGHLCIMLHSSELWTGI